MAKQKQSSSASKRREQMRQQRTSQSRSAQQLRGRNQQKSNRSSWWLVGGIIAMVVVIVGAFIFIANYEAQQSKVGSDTALKTISSIKPDVFARVDKGTFNGQMNAVKNTPVLKGPGGKPEVFYVGGEYCPYCAAQRWAIISSLSRFGSFSPLTPILSAEGQVPTFSFYKSTYHSDYIDFVSKETADNNSPNPGPLESLTPAEQQIVNQYERPPYAQQQGIPFMSIGNQYVSVGPYYSNNVLTGKSYEDIARSVTDPNSDISRGIVGAANMLTAAVCKTTNNQPANVCTADPIPSLQTSLPKPTASTASPTQLAQAWQMPEWDVRRRN
ncbi:DUF929 family protein [Dictyobacter aurantiacus]|uniref:DUF929 domain-containing protein n=1 Tax=Dictyobacter aurantiacus TaxID=1936993 RepID=A0A401ZP13_9CHLR|nr:DUF929 family protein [Dictyobacter aurantiacus]GCE08582.1 hypothetical protein KDAU_59110 [Dictyobacter aurantiacus]